MYTHLSPRAHPSEPAPAEQRGTGMTPRAEWNLIHATISPDDLANAMFLPAMKTPDVQRTIHLQVLTMPMRLPVTELAIETLPSGIPKLSFTVPNVLPPLTNVHCAARPNTSAVAMSKTTEPITFVSRPIACTMRHPRNWISSWAAHHHIPKRYEATNAHGGHCPSHLFHNGLTALLISQQNGRRPLVQLIIWSDWAIFGRSGSVRSESGKLGMRHDP
mmetsp:Transcript_12564/g.28052  ORF Transcript_12564/g.28052 Transcript_12564/m.28052 type:complete len:218 (-) Transcript_12564:85-738(-)